MRPKTNALRLLALSAIIGACVSAAKTPERRPLLVGLPVDSLIKTPKVSAVVAQRGGRVRGSSSTGLFTTFDYSADSLYGLVAIAAIKSNRPNSESLVISVREIVASVR